MDIDYIRLLMLYSDVKYPFVKAKSDPGLSEGLKSTGRFLRDNGSRRMIQNEAKQIMLLERIGQQNANKRKQTESEHERDSE